MKIVEEIVLIDRGGFAASAEGVAVSQHVRRAIQRVDWPEGTGTFSINPTKDGNGVKPIKNEAIKELERLHWVPETPYPVGSTERPGKIDAAIETSKGLFAFEWETGNISSSHRALNKLALGLHLGVTAGGVLIVPSKRLYKFLTDRVGNVEELRPYFPLWKATPSEAGLLEIIVVEHDAESTNAPFIPKGTDGRALR